MNALTPILPQERLRARIAAAAQAMQATSSHAELRNARIAWRWTRWAAMLILHMRGNSLSWIALQLRMDHSSIAYGVGAAREQAANDPDFYDQLTGLLSEIGDQVEMCALPAAAHHGVRNWRAVLEGIGAARNLTLEELTGKSQARILFEARRLAMAVLVARGNSRSQVARWLNRDHATVTHGLRKFAERAAHPDGTSWLEEYRHYAPEGVEPGDLVQVRA